MLPELTILMPHYKKIEIERMMMKLLSVKVSGDQDMISEWSDTIDTIIDNLKPGMGTRDAPRTATLHSEV